LVGTGPSKERKEGGEEEEGLSTTRRGVRDGERRSAVTGGSSDQGTGLEGKAPDSVGSWEVEEVEVRTDRVVRAARVRVNTTKTRERVEVGG
jgi:hypothetical protein